MQPFTTHTGLAAALLMPNIDTDLIIPKQFLKTLVRTGLGMNLFHELRYDAEGREVPDFVLNQARGRETTILLAGPNFGCGSSREHAPWALLDFGFRAIVAPSFADIFHNNCFQNGILPLCLSAEQIAVLAAEEGPLHLDLEAQTLRAGSTCFPFEIAPDRKRALLEGLDEIARTEQHLTTIVDYEARRRTEAPWALRPLMEA